MPIPGRTTSWATLVVLVLLTGAAAAGSLTTAPRRSSTTRRPVSAAGTLNLARRGLNQSFVATYRLTEGPGRTGSDNVLAAVVVAQRGPLANVAGEEWLQPGPGEWSYLVEWPTGEETEMVKRGDGLYSCDRSPGRSWECDGPDRYGGGNGVLIAVSAYEPVTQYGALQETLRGSPPPHDVVNRTGAISGRRVSCLTTGRPAETWCYTSRGLLASFPVSGGTGPVAGLAGTLVKSSTTVPSRQFVLPVRPSPWSGPL
jgi:hypothetical protein